MPASPIPRPTARILLLAPGERVLLFSARMRTEPDRVWWFTPGGGVNPGESLTQAAIRELAEETGHQVTADELGPVVAVCSGEWTGQRNRFLATDSFFLVRAGHDAVDVSGHEDLERSIITGHRWWSLAELDATTDLVRPPGLAGLVRRLLSVGIPPEPVTLPWG